MGRHSKQAEGTSVTDRVLLVSGAVLVALVVLAGVVVAVTFGTGGGGDGDVTAEPQGRRTPTPSASTPATPPSPSAAPAPAPSSPAGADPTPAPNGPGRTTAPPPADPPPTLVFRVVGPEAWVRVTAGDEILLSGTFPRGERRAFNEPELTVRVGDAGSVLLVVNGERRPRGEPGQVQELTVERG